MTPPARVILLTLTLGILVGPAGAETAVTETDATARGILDATGVQGGLVVHLGCGDGRLTAALRVSERYVVHGLDRDLANVARARKHAVAAGVHGPVSFSHLTGSRLPFAENLVNLLVVTDPGDVAPTEMMRVLTPGGLAYVRDGGGYRKTVKPVPTEIDEWTHFLHGPDGNAVAHDQVVGPPRRFQWTATPVWSRHHNLMPSVSAMVSAGGRLFAIVDDAPPAMTGDSPDKWSLVARDAFNGIELWRRPITDWGWRAWSWRWEGRFNQPNEIPKRIVAVGDTLYATLGFNAPLTALDAATGQVRRTYAGTQFTDEILYLDGVLILSVNHAAQRAAKVPRDPATGKEKPEPVEADPPTPKSVVAIDAATGKLLWKSKQDFIGNSTKTGGLERVTHLLLAARGGRVYLLDRTDVVALDLKTGKELWTSPRPDSKRYTSRYYHLMSDMCTLVATDDAVLLCQLEPIQKRIGWRVIKARIRAYNPATGAALWTRPCGNWGHFCVPDVFVTGGVVWVHDPNEMVMLGLDPTTGVEKRRISTAVAFTNGHHHRCYRNKATDQYLITSFRGYEFTDWETDHTNLNHWVRGACRYGGMPCNGMLYTTPHPCDCYITALLRGLTAYAPAGEDISAAPSASPRFVKGPAFGTVGNRQSGIGTPPWPTYRSDAERSGYTKADVPAKLELLWEAKVGGSMSAPVVANGLVVAASVDTHQVCAVDAKTGRPAWSYTAGGPVDTPPTLYNGLALFGCADGWVYCLRASDGRLMWRFRAAPAERMVVAYGRLESAWPVHGSVLVQNDRAYVVAGRSSFLDGGMVGWCLDPATGKVLHRLPIASEQSMTVDQGRIPTADYGIVADLLVGDGMGVYMRQRRLFGPDEGQSSWGGRIGATAGMLSDSWFNRTYWILDGKLEGETLVHDGKAVYAVRAYDNRGHGGFVTAGEAKYELAAVKRTPLLADAAAVNARRNASWKPPAEDLWTRPVSPRVRAMALAGKTLLLAGTPDALDPKEPWAAYEGKRGGVLLAISTKDGATRCEMKLSGAPIRDGIAVAAGRVYVATNAGQVLCFGQE